MAKNWRLVVSLSGLLVLAICAGVYLALILTADSDLRGIRNWLAFIPYAAAAVACGGAIGISMSYPLRRIVGRKNPAGSCQRCGYDLRASPTGCPECGDQSACLPAAFDNRHSRDSVFSGALGCPTGQSQVCADSSFRMKDLPWIRPVFIIVVLTLGYYFIVRGDYIPPEEVFGLTEEAVREQFGEPFWIQNDDGRGQADWVLYDGWRTTSLSFQNGVVVEIRHVR